MAARKLNPHTQRSHIYSCKRFAAWLDRATNRNVAACARLMPNRAIGIGDLQQSAALVAGLAAAHLTGLTQLGVTAALKLMRKLLKWYAFAPERLVTDDLRSYGSAARELGLDRRRERGRRKNNRAENAGAQDAALSHVAGRHADHFPVGAKERLASRESRINLDA